MQRSHTRPVGSAAFGDANLVSSAGLIPVITLAGAAAARYIKRRVEDAFLVGRSAGGSGRACIRIALTTKLKPYTYVSTVGVPMLAVPPFHDEDADVRVLNPSRPINDSYANGYNNSKWAAEVLLREAHDQCGLPVAVFRCDMILADTRYAGQSHHAGAPACRADPSGRGQVHSRRRSRSPNPLHRALPPAGSAP